MIDNNVASESQANEVDDLLKKKEFGSVLKQAREKAGLSVADISEKLLISADIIKAIENSQADNLPTLTFTQGYIRSYARLFELPADDIIKVYIQMAPNSKQVLTPHSVLPAQKSSDDSSIKTISIVFVLVAMAVFIYWISQTDFSLKENNSSTVDVGGTAIDIPQLVEEAEKEQKISMQNTAEASEFEILKVVEENSLPSNDAQAIAAEIILEKDEIILVATADSWCEINDADSNRLFYRLLIKDEEVKLEGRAPFVVFLGNAPDVRIEINNEIVNFEHLISSRRKTATIKIESNADVISSKSR